MFAARHRKQLCVCVCVCVCVCQQWADSVQINIMVAIRSSNRRPKRTAVRIHLAGVVRGLVCMETVLIWACGGQWALYGHVGVNGHYMGMWGIMGIIWACERQWALYGHVGDNGHIIISITNSIKYNQFPVMQFPVSKIGHPTGTNLNII